MRDSSVLTVPGTSSLPPDGAGELSPGVRSDARPSADSRRLQAIRDRLFAIEPAEWTLGCESGEGDAPATMLIETRGEGCATAIVCRFPRSGSPDEARFIAAAPDDVRFLLGLVDRAIAALRQAPLRQAQDEGVRPEGRGSDRSPPGRSGAPAQASGEAARGRERKPSDYAAEAAMKCGEPAFKAFMEQRHGLERPLTDARTAQRLRSVLGVTSRAELNDSDAAAGRWKALRREFYEWRKEGAGTR